MAGKGTADFVSAFPPWKKFALFLIFPRQMLVMAGGQRVELNSEKPLNITALNQSVLQFEWQHLIQKGSIDLIEEVELKQKVGKKWNSILTVTPTEPLVVDTFPICKAHQKLTVSITPKLGKECHPYCSSTFSDYKPIHYFEDVTPPYSCIKNSTKLFIQLNDNMVIKDIFSKCIQNVKIYEDGELSKFKGKVTLLDSDTIEIKLNNSVKFYDLVYEAISINTEKTSTILSKRLRPNWEQKCDNSSMETTKEKKSNSNNSKLLLLAFISTVIFVAIIIVTPKKIFQAILSFNCKGDADKISVTNFRKIDERESFILNEASEYKRDEMVDNDYTKECSRGENKLLNSSENIKSRTL